MLTAVLTGLVVAIGGCSAPGSATPNSNQTTPALSSTTTLSPANEPTGTATRPPDPVAASVPTLKRSNSEGKSRAKAAAQPFDKTVSYSDGVKLRVVAIKQTKTSGRGPGVFVGAPLTQVDVDLTNTSSADLKLDQVVVTMLYGSPQRVASAVYQDGAVDLAGVVPKGKSVTGRYMFSVPRKELSAVTLSVDFDGKHAAATFKGAAK